MWFPIHIFYMSFTDYGIIHTDLKGGKLIMEAPFNRIQRLWNNIRSGQMDKVFECFSPNIVVIFNGIRYSKESIIDKLDFFACRTYTIEELQVTVYEDTVLQTIYDSKINTKENGEFEGRYSIATTWLTKGEDSSISSLIITKQ